jgi:hypothetical protein
MKTSHFSRILGILAFVSILFSCERLGELYRLSDASGTKVVQGSNGTGENTEDPCGEPLLVPLVHSGDLEYTIGQIIVNQDEECLHLRFEMTLAEWTFDQIYLYVGSLDTIPLTEDPYPAFWDFDFLEFQPAVSAYDHCIPLDELTGCLQILAQVHGVHSAGGDAPLWSKGTNPGWTAGPFYTDYVCLDDCTEPYKEPTKEPCDDPCEDPCNGCKLGVYRTQTPGGWGARAAGNNPGTYRDAHFADAFPAGLLIGDPGKYHIKLTSSFAIEILLPTGGKPAVLTGQYTDPISIRNVLVGHTVALSLSVGFDQFDEDFGESDGLLKHLYIADGYGFDGMTVAEVLKEANTLLGGGSSAYTPSQMTEILTKINEYFVDGKKTGKYDLFVCK